MQNLILYEMVTPYSARLFLDTDCHIACLFYTMTKSIKIIQIKLKYIC